MKPTVTALRRTLLLQAARGCGDTDDRVLRVFPLLAHQISLPPKTPGDFHTMLCERIRAAQQRVVIASLYIGPAASDAYEKEHELLRALQVASNRGVPIQILLDQHRALRPVPKSPSSTITSASACLDAIVSSRNTNIYLLSVVPPMLSQVLSNPLDEVAGVFHIKAYIIDSELILSGANLSEEYFSDRVDRYLHISNPDLVELYAALVQALCDHAVVYTGNGKLSTAASQAATKRTSRTQLHNTLRNLLTTDVNECEHMNVDRNHDEDDPVAYAVPTFQAPPAYFKRMLPSLRSDNDVIHDLLQCATSQSPNGNIAARVSTAYLNPTNRLLQALSKFNTIHFLTAGRVSHGFKPKPKAGNRGKDWIPTVFAYAAQRIAQKAKHAHVWYYHRPDWSFHAKGIWLTDNSNVATTSTSPLLPADSELYAVTHGSSNYGERSSRRDMESNLVLVLPQGSPLVQPHVTEWNDLCKYAVSSEAEGSRPVAASIKAVFPLIKWFF